MSDIGKSDLPKFKRAYNKAVKDNQTSFMFSGNKFLVKYAKYVIEYLQHFNSI
jgi:hypothetical protein